MATFNLEVKLVFLLGNLMVSVRRNAVESREAPLNTTVSVSSQRHPEQLPEFTGTSRGTHWYRKEVRSVKSSSGSCDSSVTQLLKLKVSVGLVWLVPRVSAVLLAPASRPWKYCQEARG